MRRIGVIFAGGKSQRMGGVDKGAVLLNGRRLVDHVFERLSAQTDATVISGDSDYGLGVPAIPDRPFSFGGPAGGVYSVLDWLCVNDPDVEGFVTAPVDGPFLPDTLFERLRGAGPAIAADEAGLHPTFAYWTCRSLQESRAEAEGFSSLSLKRLAELTAARRVVWRGGENFININRAEDLARWERGV